MLRQGSASADAWHALPPVYRCAACHPDLVLCACCVPAVLLRQVEAAVEAKLRGPHSFPLERLLHVFYALFGQHDAEDEQEGGSQSQREGRGDGGGGRGAAELEQV